MLAVDIGNTTIRFAAFRGDAIVSRVELPTRTLELGHALEAFDRLVCEADDGAAWVASVYPGANAIVDSAAERLGIARRFIRPGVDPIIRHRLETPKTTGVDRLLSAMAAGALLFPDAEKGYAVVQCGSAATIDRVDGEGVFSGGYIIPGPGMWLAGLSGAAQIPDFSESRPDWRAVEPGLNTRDAVLHGMALCLPSAVASAAMFMDPDGSGLPVAVTGGWAGEITGLLGESCVLAPDLLLQGIRVFAHRVMG